MIPGTETFLPNQPRPNFFVAGVAKGGTTSLYEYLKQHPQIFLSEKVKEPCYFIPTHQSLQWNDYLKLFAEAGDKQVIGDCSAIYASCPESAGWIKSVFGDVKIILILRNPARRALSLYGWMVREGFEDAPTFAEALDREPLRLKDKTFRATCPQFFDDYLYFTTGFYFETVKRCFDTFGRDRVKIYLFEEFVRNPLPICQDVFRFLEVDPNFVPQIGVHNEGRIPKSIAWQYWLRPEPKRKRWFGCRSLRRRLVKTAMNLNARLGTKPRTENHLLEELTARYREDIEKLQPLIGRDLSMWM